MDVVELKDLNQFHEIFRTFRSHDGLGSWFRGQANSDWGLLPSAGRQAYFLPNNRDLGRFNDWESNAIAYDDLPTSDLEKLAIAQHHGLATRLLDWTKNPLVAAYFSVISNPQDAGAIYILEVPNDFSTKDMKLDTLKEHSGVLAYIPRLITSRIVNQKGMFTVHCPANKEIELSESRISKGYKNLTKIIISPSLKSEVEKMLDDYGINWQTLFSDLDGLSKYKNRYTQQMVARNAK